MIKIGEFSQLSRVSIKTLRYYDRIGLLKPKRVDTLTGHRFYSLDQLHHLNRILALKALGLSLEQIQDVLADDLSDSQLVTMLVVKQAELLQTLSDIQKQVDLLDTRIQYVQQEGKMPDYEVIIRTIPAQRVLSIRQILKNGGMIEPLLQDIYEVLKAQQIESTGEWMTLYHHEGFRSENLDVEVAIPIGDLEIERVKLDDSRELTVRTIEGHDTVATVIERGENDSWAKSYHALADYLKEHDYDLILPTREVYLTDNDAQSEWLVEIQYPLKKASTN